jgi:SAM-dependent methyltransferase
MLRYYLWAIAEKTLSYTPRGEAIYYGLGRIINRNSKGAGPQFVTSLPVARKARELLQPDARVLDLGTGWFHHDAFLLYLVGDYEFILFDVMDKARLVYIQNYLRNLSENADYIGLELGLDPSEIRDKLDRLLALPDRESIYRRCKFRLCITDKVDEPFLPAGSVDFVVSNCVLVHIRPDVLAAELRALREMLAPGGRMYHMLGHDDHWAFHDPKVAWPSFNYMRYSEATYRRLFDTKFEYHNRMVKPEWIELFDRCGLRIDEYTTNITDASRRNVLGLPRLDERFARYDLEDLAVIHSYVLLARYEAKGL